MKILEFLGIRKKQENTLPATIDIHGEKMNIYQVVNLVGYQRGIIEEKDNQISRLHTKVEGLEAELLDHRTIDNVHKQENKQKLREQDEQIFDILKEKLVSDPQITRPDFIEYCVASKDVPRTNCYTGITRLIKAGYIKYLNKQFEIVN